MLKRMSLVIAIAALLPLSATAEEYSFNVDSKFVNITFESQMDVEDILGASHEVSGSLNFDGRKGNFSLAVPISSMKTGIDLRDEHMRSPMWLDAEAHPEIKFEGNKIRSLGDGKYQVTGNLTMHGVSQSLSVVVATRQIPAERASKLMMGDTNWLRVRTSFKVSLSDFGVKIPDMAAAKVSDEWTIKVSLFAKEL